MSSLPVIPSLTALRAFEAAIRRGSFRDAAEELSVTPAAVSHQIQHLEAMLGTKLFLRKHRAIAPTEAALRCLPKIQEGFESIREALDRAVHDYPNVLTIGAPPSLMSQWLMPRLHRFAVKFPDFILRTTVKTRLPLPLSKIRRAELQDVLRWTEECDVLVVYGSGNYPGMNVQNLFPTDIAPVCSPRLLSKGRRLNEPGDLRNFNLIHDDRGLLYEGTAFWDLWLDHFNYRGINTETGTHYDYSSFAIQAAVDGLGVVVTTPILADDEIKSGALTLPFPGKKARIESGYFLVTSDAVRERLSVKQFCAWALLEGLPARAPQGKPEP
jgi:LysR family glycine cleavage system transcriptional activator